MAQNYNHAYEYQHLEPATAAELTGVRTARILAFLIDYLLVALFSIPFAVIIAILGVLTFGLGWALYAILPATVALIYVALTMGGPNQATIGMGMMGIRIRKLEGGRVDPFLAILHSVLFWLFLSFPVLLLVTFFSSRKRLLHDVLLGTWISRV